MGSGHLDLREPNHLAQRRVSRMQSEAVPGEKAGEASWERPRGPQGSGMRMGSTCSFTKLPCMDSVPGPDLMWQSTSIGPASWKQHLMWEMHRNKLSSSAKSCQRMNAKSRKRPECLAHVEAEGKVRGRGGQNLVPHWLLIPLTGDLWRVSIEVEEELDFKGGLLAAKQTGTLETLAQAVGAELEGWINKHSSAPPGFLPSAETRKAQDKP